MYFAILSPAMTLAITIYPRISPIIEEGKPKYVAVLHPYSINQLRTETGEAGWNLIQGRSGIRGPQNPIYTGAMGEYNGIVIHESEYIPTNDGSTVLTGFTVRLRIRGADGVNLVKTITEAAVPAQGHIDLPVATPPSFFFTFVAADLVAGGLQRAEIEYDDGVLREN